MRVFDCFDIVENMFVIYISDNGFWFLYGNYVGLVGLLWEGKGMVWEGGVCELCIMCWL